MDDNNAGLWVGIYADDRAKLIDTIDKLIANSGFHPRDKSVYLAMECPCGIFTIFKSANDIPTKSMLSACGVSNHWAIYYDNQQTG